MSLKLEKAYAASSSNLPKKGDFSMSISADYQDWDSDVTQSFFSPAMDKIHPGDVIKKVACSVWIKGYAGLVSKYSLKEQYDLFEVPQDNRTLFQKMKEMVSAPPKNGKEAKMTPEELKAWRDPEELYDLPFESPLVQNALQKLRNEVQTPPIEKIKNLYLECMQNVKKFSDPGQNVEMDRIKIKVVFASKSDLQDDQTFCLEVGQKTKGHTL